MRKIKRYVLMYQWERDINSPASVIGVFSTKEKAEDYGRKWWKSDEKTGYGWYVVSTYYNREI